MATIKISQLNAFTALDPNTANTLFPAVDVTLGVTGKITATTLAQGLYSNNPLTVGGNQILYPNTIAQFSGNSITYLQTNFQNFTPSGSVDVVLTSDVGTNSNNYIDLGINNSQFADPNFTSMYPLDGYLYVSGPNSQSYSGNLVIGTASYGANINFIAGGTTYANIVATFNEDYATLKRPLIINHNPSSPFYANIVALEIINQGNTYALHISGNTFFAGNIATSGVMTLSDGSHPASNSFVSSNDTVTLSSAKSYTDSANSWICSNYLANTSGALFNGILNIGDKLNVNGSVIFANTNFTSTQAAMTIAACPIGDIQLPSNDGYMLHISGKQNVSSRIVFDSFGANTYAVVAGRTARGTPTAPQAVVNGDILMRISGNGYGTTKYASIGSGRIDIVATETHTDTSRATQIQFFTTVAGTNTQTQIASFNGSSAVFTGVVNPQKGFIYNPNVISGIINTLTIDIANNSLYRFNCNATTNISLSGYQTGKVVEVWIKNVDNNNHTVTHGCLANNSTVGTTSFSLTSGHSAYLKYFSIDGDQANTFVSIIYS